MSENCCTRSRSLARMTNRRLFALAEMHGVLLTDLVTPSVNKTRQVVKARHEFIEWARENIVYYQPPGLPHNGSNSSRDHRAYFLRSEVPDKHADLYRTISTPDIARCLSANHSTIVLALRALKESKNATV